MEQIISETETHVDKCFGRDSSNSQFHLGKKYELIFIIARNIPAEFKQMKNFILLFGQFGTYTTLYDSQ